jgi:hypothetical protein
MPTGICRRYPSVIVFSVSVSCREEPSSTVRTANRRPQPLIVRRALVVVLCSCSCSHIVWIYLLARHARAYRSARCLGLRLPSVSPSVRLSPSPVGPAAPAVLGAQRSLLSALAAGLSHRSLVSRFAPHQSSDSTLLWRAGSWQARHAPRAARARVGARALSYLCARPGAADADSRLRARAAARNCAAAARPSLYSLSLSRPAAPS